MLKSSKLVLLACESLGQAQRGRRRSKGSGGDEEKLDELREKFEGPVEAWPRVKTFYRKDREVVTTIEFEPTIKGGEKSDVCLEEGG